MLPDALGICGLMPSQFMELCPKEYEIMLDSKIKLLRISHPHVAPKEEPDPIKQSQEEQMQMITMANGMMGGSQ